MQLQPKVELLRNGPVLEDMGTIILTSETLETFWVMSLSAWKALDLALRTKNGDLPNRRWRRRRVRPRRTWVDHIKEDVAALLDSLMCLVADRQAWRSRRYGPPPTMRL